MHALSPPSAWLLRWAHLLPPQGRLLDLACGSGRHLHWALAQGHVPTGVDRDAAALSLAPSDAERVQADIENGPWPWPERQFDAVLVFNYLWRPLWPQLLASLAPGGVLVYETFAHGNASVGRPARPDFLLQPGELLTRCESLRVIAYEDGYLNDPPRFVQRIVARRPHPDDLSPIRHPLSP